MTLVCSWAQKVDVAPIPVVGDKWVYKFTNFGDKKEPVTWSHQAVFEKNSSVWMYVDDKNPETNRAQAFMRWDSKRGRTVEGFRYQAEKPTEPGSRYGNWQPEDDIVQFPLEVGKKYKARFDFTNDNRTSYDDLTIEVKAFEKIKVIAGEFDAFKIEIKGWWNCTIGCQGSGRIERFIWWAPSVKREVKTTAKSWTTNSSMWGNSERELISWEPNAALPALFAAKSIPSSDTAVPAAAK